MNRRSAAIVVSMGLLSCRPTSPPQPPEDTQVHMNPGPTEVPDEARLPPTNPPIANAPPFASQSVTDASKYSVRMNPRDANSQQIYLAYGDPRQCVIYAPWPKGQPIPPPGSPIPTTTVDCPPIMLDPAWDECRMGDISSTEDGSACDCFQMSNPPPPPHTISHCPKAPG
jgi:hypothetical protein